MKNKIGIITANYNNARFLSEYFDGIINQKLLPDYVAFVDDCSTDDSVEVINSLIANYKGTIQFIVSSTHKNSGPAAARNVAIEILKSNCNILCVCDSDDIYYNNKISRSMEVLDKFPQMSLVYSDYDMIYTDDDKKQTREFKEPFNMSRLLDECIVSNNSIFKTELIDIIGNYDETLFGPEDYDMWIRIAEVSPIYHIPEALYAYRISGTNLTITTPNQQFAEHVMKVKRKTHERRTNQTVSN